MRSEGPKIAYLDGWRGVAITLVMVGHFFPYWRIHFGLLGVDVFFVLSGHLMTKLLFDQKTPIKEFYKRRISRIFPAFYSFLLVLLLSYWIIGIPIASGDAIGGALFIRNYYPSGLGNLVALDHIWSLSVEEHSYVALSLIAILSRRSVIKPIHAIGGFLLLFITASFYYSGNFPQEGLYANKLIHTEVAAFGIFSSAFIYILSSTRKINTHPIQFYLLPVLSVAANLHNVPFGPIQFIGVASLALMVNTLYDAPHWIRRVLSSQILQKLGLWSFSIYLWQQPFYVLKNNGIFTGTEGVFISLMIGIASYYIIENPARNYLNNKWSKKSSFQAGEAIPNT